MANRIKADYILQKVTSLRIDTNKILDRVNNAWRDVEVKGKESKKKKKTPVARPWPKQRPEPTYEQQQPSAVASGVGQLLSRI